MLQNEPSIAKIGFGSVESGPSNVWATNQPPPPRPAPLGQINGGVVLGVHQLLDVHVRRHLHLPGVDLIRNRKSAAPDMSSLYELHGFIFVMDLPFHFYVHTLHMSRALCALSLIAPLPMCAFRAFRLPYR